MTPVLPFPPQEPPVFRSNLTSFPENLNLESEMPEIEPSLPPDFGEITSPEDNSVVDKSVRRKKVRRVSGAKNGTMLQALQLLGVLQLLTDGKIQQRTYNHRMDMFWRHQPVFSVSDICRKLKKTSLGKERNILRL